MDKLTIKSETAQSYTIVGHGIVWGGEDLEGEHFEPDTDLWLDKLTPTPMVLFCLLYTSPSPRDRQRSRMPSSA